MAELTHPWAEKMLKELGFDTEKFPVKGFQLTVEVGKVPTIFIQAETLPDKGPEMKKYYLVEFD